MLVGDGGGGMEVGGCWWGDGGGGCWWGDGGGGMLVGG